MDPTSSLGRIFLGENVYGSSSEKVKGHGDLNAPEYTDTTGNKEKKVTKALGINVGTSSSTGRHLTQEEAPKEALALRISQKFALLEKVR
ncbi:hypothetical protein Tco_1213296 [Tanacetum coccineum]